MEVYQKALTLNKDRFHDVDLIQIGDTILLPALIGAGTEYWVADFPQANVHDCIWRITARYLDKGIETAPLLPDSMNAGPIFCPGSYPIPEEKSSWPWWLILLLIVSLEALAFFVWDIIRRNNRRPVIAGGLSDDPALAARQISAAYPNQSPAVTVTRGILISPDGRPAMVNTRFANGSRIVPLESGEQVYQVVRRDGSTNYYRQHCGNLIGEISDGQFELPEGWEFVPMAESHTPVTAAASVNNAANSSENATENHPVVPAAIDFQGLAQVIEAASKVTHDSVEITLGELSIKLSGAQIAPAAEEKK